VQADRDAETALNEAGWQAEIEEILAIDFDKQYWYALRDLFSW
jgi:hypothetical protein